MKLDLVLFRIATLDVFLDNKSVFSGDQQHRRDFRTVTIVSDGNDADWRFIHGLEHDEGQLPSCLLDIHGLLSVGAASPHHKIGDFFIICIEILRSRSIAALRGAPEFDFHVNSRLVVKESKGRD